MTAKSNMIVKVYNTFAVVSLHDSKAVCAHFMAFSVSAAFISGTVPILSPLDGLNTEIYKLCFYNYSTTTSSQILQFNIQLLSSTVIDL
jgi:hypothetical protein